MNLIFTEKIHSDWVNGISFHPCNPDLVVTGGGDRKVTLFSLKTKKIVWTNDEFRTGVYIVEFNKNGTLIAVGGFSNQLMILNAEAGKSCFMRYFGDWIISLSFRSDDKMVVGLDNGTVLIVNPQMNRIEKTVKVSDFYLRAIAISPLSDDLILMGVDGGAIKLMNFKEKNVVREYEKHLRSVRTLQWTADGSKFVSASHDGTARLYSMDQNHAMVKYDGHKESARFASLIHHDEVLITVSIDDSIKCWEVSSGKCFKTVNSSSKLYCGALSKDEKVIAIGCDDGSIEIYSCPPRSVYSLHKKYMLSCY